jgi:hypothetical protein
VAFKPQSESCKLVRQESALLARCARTRMPRASGADRVVAAVVSRSGICNAFIYIDHRMMRRR